jgi:hypothetical protein
MLRVDRNRLGLRVYVFRRRVHEWHLGLAALAADAVAVRLAVLSLVPAVLVAAAGLWLVVKDWADITRAGHDTRMWPSACTGGRRRSARRVTWTTCPRSPRPASRSSR